jgi:mRNA interferase MazF
VIRGAVYRVDLGDAKRGHEQRGRRYGLVIDQIRSIDTSFVHGDPVHYLGHHELMEIETAIVRYLGLDTWAGLSR